MTNQFILNAATNQIQINLIIDQFCHIILKVANKTIGRTNSQLKRKKFPGGIMISTMQSSYMKKH
jgi:hypothetical protein